MKQTFEADDGSKFSSAAECKEYESRSAICTQLAGLSVQDVAAALSRVNPDLANVIERAGAAIARTRIKNGDLRRKRGGRVKTSKEIGAVSSPAP